MADGPLSATRVWYPASAKTQRTNSQIWGSSSTIRIVAVPVSIGLCVFLYDTKSTLWRFFILDPPLFRLLGPVRAGRLPKAFGALKAGPRGEIARRRARCDRDLGAVDPDRREFVDQELAVNHRCPDVAAARRVHQGRV